MADRAADGRPDRGFRAIDAFEWQSVLALGAMSGGCFLAVCLRWEDLDPNYMSVKFIGVFLAAGLAFGLISLVGMIRLVEIVVRGRAATEAKGPPKVMGFIGLLLKFIVAKNGK